MYFGRVGEEEKTQVVYCTITPDARGTEGGRSGRENWKEETKIWHEKEQNSGVDYKKVRCFANFVPILEYV